MATILNILALVLLILNAENKIYSVPSLTPAKIYLQVMHRNKNVRLNNSCFTLLISHTRMLVANFLSRSRFIISASICDL